MLPVSLPVHLTELLTSGCLESFATLPIKQNHTIAARYGISVTNMMLHEGPPQIHQEFPDPKKAETSYSIGALH